MYCACFSMLSASKSGIRNKITQAVVSLRTITTFTHPTLCTLCVQWFAKSIYTHFARCVVCAIVMPRANTCWQSGIGRNFFCFAWSPTDQKSHGSTKASTTTNIDHRSRIESYHSHSITIIHQTSKLNNQQPTLNRHNKSIITHQASIIKHHSSTNNDLQSLSNHQSTLTSYHSSPLTHQSSLKPHHSSIISHH